MRIEIGPFKAMTPAVSSKMLPSGGAQKAVGTDLYSGELRPFHKRKLVKALQGLGSYDIGTIFRWWTGSQSYWLRFPGHVDVVNGPLADDVWERVYWTGDKRYAGPRMSYTGKIQSGSGDYPSVSYKLGVPAPADTISNVAKSAASSGDIQQVHRERPMRVRTVQPHNLETGDVVRFDLDGSGSLAQYLNQGEFQVRVTADDEFTLNNTDGANVEYDPFDGGTFERYFAPGRLETRFYVHTFVTEIGEEGPPSEPSSEVVMGRDQGATLTLPAPRPNETQGRVLDRRRIYRTATSAQGGQFQFLAEVDITETSYTDETPADELDETIPSTAWDPPPDNLKGLRVAPQGFLAGFFDNKVAFSEPYQPHAWPTDYQLALDSEVVAVEVIDNGVVAGTTGRPYLIQGIDPRSMTPRRLEVDHACLSAASMVSLGYAAIYASQDGLVQIDSGGARLITAGVVTENEWRPYNPETIHAYEWSGQYIAFYSGANGKGGFLFDPRSPERGIVELGFWVRSAFSESRSPLLFVLNASEDVEEWDHPDADLEAYRWRSAVFPAPRPSNMALAKVTASSYSDLVFRIYAEGELITEKPVPGLNPFRLPSGYLARDFEIELEGTDAVQRVEVGESASEVQ